MLRGYLYAALMITVSPGLGASWDAQKLYEFTDRACASRDADGGPNPEIVSRADGDEPLEFRNRRIGTRYRFSVEENALIELDAIKPGLRLTRLVGRLSNRFGDSLALSRETANVPSSAAEPVIAS